MNYRMKGSDQFEASRTVREALTGKPQEQRERVIARLLDAAYRSEMDMEKLRALLAE